MTTTIRVTYFCGHVYALKIDLSTLDPAILRAECAGRLCPTCQLEGRARGKHQDKMN